MLGCRPSFFVVGWTLRLRKAAAVQLCSMLRPCSRHQPATALLPCVSLSSPFPMSCMLLPDFQPVRILTVVLTSECIIVSQCTPCTSSTNTSQVLARCNGCHQTLALIELLGAGCARLCSPCRTHCPHSVIWSCTSCQLQPRGADKLLFLACFMLLCACCTGNQPKALFTTCLQN